MVKQINKGFGIASLVLGITGLIFSFTFFLTPPGFVLSSLAIIFAGIQKKKTNVFTGYGTAGLITGIIGGAINLIIGIPLAFVWIALAFT